VVIAEKIPPSAFEREALLQVFPTGLEHIAEFAVFGKSFQLVFGHLFSCFGNCRPGSLSDQPCVGIFGSPDLMKGLQRIRFYCVRIVANHVKSL